MEKLITPIVNDTELILPLKGRIDTNNAPALDAEISEITAAHSGLPLVFDARQLEYISSAGLRVLLKIAKSCGKKVKVLNVPKDVYEIFETTGFTNILDVHKALREISVEGCPLLGSGGYGKVYRLDEETIAKLYSSNFSLEMVQQERNTAQKAFLLGVPTAISYDVVKCGDCYGVVYELLNAKTLAQTIYEAPSKIPEMAKRAASLLKEMHKISIQDKSFPNKKEILFDWLNHVSPYITPEETEEIRNFIASVPDANSFIHGDYNAKNIMVQDDKMILIDIGDAAYGHPVLDVADLIFAYKHLPNASIPDETKFRLIGFNREDAPAMLNALIGEYFGVSSPDEIKKYLDMLMPYADILIAYHISHRFNYAKDMMEKSADLLIRKQLLPAIRSAVPLEW